MATKKQTPSGAWNLQRILPWLLTIAGTIAFLASFALTIEKIDLLKNPHYQPVCNLNPVLSCTNVTNSNQAEVFGFPNPLLGVAGFAAVTAIGVALLAGAKFKKWFWVTIGIGMLLAAAGLHWLMFQTLYRIDALCIYCMMVWFSIVPAFWYVTLYNLRSNNIKTPAKLSGAVNFMQRHHGDILLLWFLLIIVLIGNRFWYYWSTLI